MIESVDSDAIYRVLDHFKKSKKFKLSIEKLDKVMQNIGRGQFTYDVFKAAFDSDPKLQNLVTDFNKDTIELKSSELDDVTNTAPKNSDTVSKMAQAATDLKNGL